MGTPTIYDKNSSYTVTICSFPYKEMENMSNVDIEKLLHEPFSNILTVPFI